MSTLKLYLRWYILGICSYSLNERRVFFIKKIGCCLGVVNEWSCFDSSSSERVLLLKSKVNLERGRLSLGERRVLMWWREVLEGRNNVKEVFW